MSNNQFPFFVGAKLRLVNTDANILFPEPIATELRNGLVIEIAGITENGNPYFMHDLGYGGADFRWSIIDSEAEHFELVNPREELKGVVPLKVKDLHPKDIALVQAMHIIHRTQQRMATTGSLELDVTSHDYLVGNFLYRPVEAVKALHGYGAELMQDLTINYNLKEAK